MHEIRLTRVKKQGGALLYKRIFRGKDGLPLSDGSPCALDRADQMREEVSAILDPKKRSELGQFMTPRRCRPTWQAWSIAFRRSFICSMPMEGSTH